jgi:transcriptional regulator with XRE-family HTH domain
MELGNRIHLLRKKNHLTQEELGKKVLGGLSARVVSNIELGARAITQDEIEKIEKYFNVHLAEVDLPEDPDSAEVFFTDQEFFDWQANFLGDNRGEYSMWFVNPEELPMLHSDVALESWTRNLAQGVSYHIMCLLDFLNGETFRHLKDRMENAVFPLSQVMADKAPGKIYLYPMLLGASSTARDMARIYDSRVCGSSDSSTPRSAFIEYRRVLDLSAPPGHFTEQDRLHIIAFLIQYNFKEASLVAYDPGNGIADPDYHSYLALELADVATKSEAGKCGLYVRLNSSTTSDFYQHLDNVRTVLRKLAPTSDSGISGNGNNHKENPA